MFKASLKSKLISIFDLDKVSFDLPGESEEQEGVFIQVEDAKIRIKDAKQIARVSGKLHIFANSDKLPYGYFSKKIAESDLTLTKDIFFHDFEDNRGSVRSSDGKGSIRNIVERSVSFVYLYNSQYDPDIGEIDEINFSYVEN